MNSDEKKPKVLYYNDDLEELEKFGYLKYIAYPLLKVYKFSRNSLVCCKRNEERTNNEERPDDEEEVESPEDNY